MWTWRLRALSTSIRAYSSTATERDEILESRIDLLYILEIINVDYVEAIDKVLVIEEELIM